MLQKLITSRTRVKLLIKFFLNSDNRLHLRGLSEELGESTNAIRVELNRLSDAGLLLTEKDRNRILYRSNENHPLHGNLRDLVTRHLGLDVLVERVLDRMGDVDQVVLTGDYARGLDTGTIDISVIGNDLNRQYLSHLSSRLEDLIGRKVAFILGDKEMNENGMVLYDRSAENI